MSTETKTFQIDRNVWYRGHGWEHSRLLLNPAASARDPYTGEPKREQCCVGIICTQMGVPDNAIIGVGGLNTVYPNSGGRVWDTYPGLKYEKWEAVLYRIDPTLYDEIGQIAPWGNSLVSPTMRPISDFIYTINDWKDITDVRREDLLTRLFALVDINVEFVN